MCKLVKGKMHCKNMDCMAKIENHLINLDKEFVLFTNSVEKLNIDMLEELKILEIENNKLKIELGSRKNVIISE